MSRVLAVDGGNSKTDLVVCEGSGQILGRVRGPGCSPDSLGVDGSVAVLAALVDDLRAVAGPEHGPVAEAGAFLLAGVDRPDQETSMADALAPLGVARDLAVANDTFAVLRAGSPHGWGVAVVCGAGLNVVGVTQDGRVGRYQALGELSGDWGGGYSLGLAALGAAIRGDDGRGPATMLTAAVPGHFGLETPQAVAAAIHEERLDNNALVELAPAVFAAADEGDDVAGGLLDRLADEVVTMAMALARRLDLATAGTTVVLGGGLLQVDDPRVTGRIRTAIARDYPDVHVHLLDVPPVVGAVRTGLEMLGLPGDAVDVALKRSAEGLVT